MLLYLIIDYVLTSLKSKKLFVSLQAGKTEWTDHDIIIDIFAFEISKVAIAICKTANESLWYI